MAKDIKEIHKKHLADPEVASEYLNQAFDTRDQAVILMAIRNVVDAQDKGLSGVASLADVGRESLYKTLSEKGNPKLDNLSKLLHSVGLQLCVKPERKSME